MNIIRLIFVSRPKSSTKSGACFKEPGCVSEKLLKCTDDPGEFISYSEWDNQDSIDAYRRGAAHEEIKKHTSSIHSSRPTVKRYEEV